MILRILARGNLGSDQANLLINRVICSKTARYFSLERQFYPTNGHCKIQVPHKAQSQGRGQFLQFLLGRTATIC